MRFEELEKTLPEGQPFCVYTEKELLITDSDRHDLEAQEIMKNKKVLEIRLTDGDTLDIFVEE